VTVDASSGEVSDMRLEGVEAPVASRVAEGEDELTVNDADDELDDDDDELDEEEDDALAMEDELEDDALGDNLDEDDEQ